MTYTLNHDVIRRKEVVPVIAHRRDTMSSATHPGICGAWPMHDDRTHAFECAMRVRNYALNVKCVYL